MAIYTDNPPPGKLDVTIHQLKADDAYSITQINRIVINGSDVKKFYHPIFDENISVTIENKGFGLGAFYDDKMVGYQLVRYASEFKNENLASELGFTEEQTKKLIKLSGMAILPSFAGRGIGPKLLTVALSLMKKKDFSYVVGNCHVENVKSLRMLNKLGFIRKKVFTKYDQPKYLIFRDLN